MSHFHNKPLTEIKPEDIRDLVNAGTVEDEELDFKHISWPDDEDGRFELLHDITALGNAQGGYLLIGIGTRKDAAGRDVPSGFASVRYFSVPETNRRLTELAEEVRFLREEMTHLLATVTSGESDVLSQTNIDRFLEMMEERFRRRYEGGEHTKGA